MKIIGHRGAKGLAPENTIAAIKRGIVEGLDGIELDVHVTKDGKLILLHDDSFRRTCGVSKNADEMTVEQIMEIRTHEGEPIPTLEQALDAINGMTIVAEGKGKGWAEPLAELLSKHPVSKDCIVISFDHDELAAFGKLSPKHKLYGLEDQRPFAAIRSALRNGFHGIDINYKTLNPIVYWWAKINKLDIIVYTVNRPLDVMRIKLFYPRTTITTDFPNLMQRFRR